MTVSEFFELAPGLYTTLAEERPRCADKSVINRQSEELRQLLSRRRAVATRPLDAGFWLEVQRNRYHR